MSRGIQHPDKGDDGYESHPAFAKISAARVQGSGRVLFDSDVLHQHTVVIRIDTAERKRELHRDWIHERKRVVELELSEAQWASFVSSMNSGGTPATLRWTRQDGEVPQLPFQPSLQASMDEVRDAASRIFANVQAALAAYEEHKTAANLRALHAAITNADGNVAFAASSLKEHVENVTAKARADIEAFVTAKATQLGLDPATVAALQLGVATADSSEQEATS